MRFHRRSFLSASIAAALAFWLSTARSQEARKPSLSNPTPEDARHFAETIVRLAKRVDGAELDYSPESLKQVDRIVLQLREEGNTVNQIGATLVAFGCYVGEVMVRNLDAKWDYPSEKERAVGFDIIGVRMKTGGFWHPIGKVFKLLQNGSEDSVAYLYAVARGQ